MSNDFLPFATAGGANVVTQAAYAALAALSTGYGSGIAQSAEINKTLRQSSIMAAVLAQFAADYSGQNSTDDGTTATLEANIVTAIRNATKTTVTLTDTGTANAYAAANTPPLVAGTWVNNVAQQVKIVNANTGASTYAPDGLTAIPIYGLGLQPLQGGELIAGGTAILMKQTITGVNSGNPIAVLLECSGGAQQVAPATQSQHAVNLGQFASSKAANGYTKLPNGVIIQWGTVTTSASADVAVTFPIAFPSAAASLALSAGMGSPIFAGYNTLATSGFNANSYTPGSARASTGVFWISIGY